MYHSCPFTSNQFDLHHLTTPLVTSHIHALPYYIWQGTELLSVDLGCRYCSREKRVSPYVCVLRTSRRASQWFLKYVICPAGIYVIELVHPACDQVIGPSHSFIVVEGKVFMLSISFALSLKFRTSSLDGWSMATSVSFLSKFLLKKWKPMKSRPSLDLTTMLYFSLWDSLSFSSSFIMLAMATYGLLRIQYYHIFYPTYEACVFFCCIFALFCPEFVNLA